MHPGMGAEDKKLKAELLEDLFETRSWTAVENKSVDKLELARNKLWLKSRGHAYGVKPPVEGEESALVKVA